MTDYLAEWMARREYLKRRGKEVGDFEGLKKAWGKLVANLDEDQFLDVRDDIQDIKNQIKKGGSKMKKAETKEVAPKAVEKDISPSIDDLLGASPVEEKAEKTKKEVKAATKANKAKVKDDLVADKSFKQKCCICGKLIGQGHIYVRLIADDIHPERFYHKKTCGPGSENWEVFKANGKKVPGSVMVEKGKKEATTKKAVAKESNGKNQYGHLTSKVSGILDSMLIKGATVKEFSKIYKGDFTWNAEERFKAHLAHLKKDHEVKIVEKDGHYRITA